MTEDRAPSTAAVDRPARSLRTSRVCRWAGRILGALTIAVLALPVLVYLLLAGTEVTAPDWLRREVEARAGTVLDGADLRFAAMTIRLEGDLRPHVVLSDAILRDPDGRVLARVPEIGLQFSPRGLVLRRELLVQQILILGAEISLERDAGGRFALQLGEAAAVEQMAGLAALLDAFDSLFERPALAALQTVRIAGLVVNYTDLRAGSVWTLDGGELALELRGDVTRLSGDVSLLSGRAFVTRLVLEYESPRASPAARVAVTLTDASARDIASQSPALAWLGVLDAPISADMRGEIDATGQPGVFTAALEIGQGALAPIAGARPVAFQRALAHLAYDPSTSRLHFDRVEVQSDWGALSATGQADLQAVGPDGWPSALVGQFALSGISLNPDGLFDTAISLPEAWVDFRLRLDPFRLTLADLTLAADTAAGQGRMTARGEIAAAPEGWSLSLDLGLESLTVARMLALWPQTLMPGTRAWMAGNLSAGEMTNLAGALRLAPGAAPVLALTKEFRDVTVRLLRQQDPVTGADGFASLIDHGFSLSLTAGTATPPLGGPVDLAGSVLVVPDVRQAEVPAEIMVRTDSKITAALSVLDGPPFGYLSRSGLPVDLAEGQARTDVLVRLPLGRELTPEDRIDWRAEAVLRDLSSTALVPGRVLTAARLEVDAGPEALEIAGPVRLGAVPARGIWRLPLGEGADGGSRVTAEVELSDAFMREFAIGLPAGMVQGSGQAQLGIDLPPEGPGRMELSSDLTGLRLSLPALGWTKAPATPGRFDATVQLGTPPRIERLRLDAPGLRAEGEVRLRAGGGLDQARFVRVERGDWFDAPVTLLGRGADRNLGVEIGGGRIDLRRAAFGDAGGGSGDAPLRIRLDRLQVSDGIALTGFEGTFDAARGLEGEFTATVNGGTPVQGWALPQGQRTAVRIISRDAGGVIRDAGLIGNAEGGLLDLTLLPVGLEGQFDGNLRIDNIRVRDAPALASLLNAISVIGLLQQMAGQGLVFDEVRAAFRLAPDRITITRSSAVGPGLGISLDGFYMPATNEVDFQGVVSPLYLVNSVGAVLTRRGEGLIGFNFNLRGQAGNPRVLVNPLSALTPGMFREIFRRPPPELTD
ncbi:MAG: DUF3971 domain-containing protein [Rubellimicrobium sp.]|nr:DUF3971 domain-containing protein [Rubellimicrobium sp.]